MKPKFSGETLILPHWTFSGPAPRVPHRSRTLAQHKSERTEFFVCANHKRNLFWVHAIGPGFAGDRSRHSLTCVTRNAGLAELWIAAVNSGKVRIE